MKYQNVIGEPASEILEAADTHVDLYMYELQRNKFWSNQKIKKLKKTKNMNADDVKSLITMTTLYTCVTFQLTQQNYSQSIVFHSLKTRKLVVLVLLL